MTLRRKLLLYSAPVVLAVLVIVAKLVSVSVAGHSAVQDFADSDTASLADDVDTLQFVNIIEPAKAPFAAGVLAALEKRFDDAERELLLALDRTDHADSCPVRVNLELVRESLGDQAAGTFDPQAAVQHYLAAKQVVEQAPANCFAGNSDDDPERRAVRADSSVRLDAKIAGVAAPPPPPPPAPPPVQAPVAGAPGGAPPDDDRRGRLNPGSGDPLEQLQQILRDAAR
ncbi:hypothetical protein ACWDUN_12455 [Mycobacterium sp. NPDC003323]